MPATVEGAFVLIDRASSTLDKIRQRADRTDRAVENLGDRLDKIGGNAQLRRMELAEREIANVGRSSQVAEQRVTRMGNAAQRVDRQVGGLGARIRELGATLMGLRAIMKPALFAAIGVAVGSLTQGISALTAGIVALGPKIVDLTGALGALPATIVGVGLAVATTKLAFKDLGEAMGGNREALRRLTPEARQFVDTLKSFRPVIRDLRRAAQGGLFPGLDAALQNLRRGAPMMERLLARMGRTLGRGAAGLAGRLTTAPMLRDLEALGNQGSTIVGRMIRGFGNLAEAIVDVARAAEPFTDWLSETVLGWTRYAREAAAAGRENGRLAVFFTRSRDALETFGRIAGNLWTTLRNIGRAARPLGEDLYDGLERASARWAAWSRSMQGQNRLARWFTEARAPLFAFFGLIADLGVAIATIDMTGLTGTMNALRDVVPDLKRGLEALAGFGPTLVAGLGQAVRLIANVTEAGGPLAMLFTALTNILGVVNDLIEQIPIFGSLLTAGVVLAGLARLRAGIAGLASSWGGVAAAATGAAAAQQAAATGASGAAAAAAAGSGAAAGGAAVAAGAAGAGRGAGGGVGGFRQRFNETAAARRSATLTAAGGGGMSPAAMAERTAARATLAGPSALGAALGGTALGAAYTARRGAGAGRTGAAAGVAGRGAGRAAGRVGMAALRFLPGMALLGGLLGAAQGTGGRGAGGLAQNTLSGITMGLFPSTASQDAGIAEQEQAGAGREQAAIVRGLGAADRVGGVRGQERGVEILRQEIELRKGATGAQAELRAQLEAELQVRRQTLRATRAQARAMRDATDIRRADRFTASIKEAFNIRARRFGTETAMKQMTGRMMANMRGMGREGRLAVARNTLSWAREQARQNPKLVGEVERLEARIKRSFGRQGEHVVIVNGRIFRNSQTAWKSISTTMIGEAERARLQTGQAFDQVYAKAIGALQDMGFSRAQARGLIKGSQSGNAGTRATANERAASGPLEGRAAEMYRGHDYSRGRQAHGGRVYAGGGRLGGFGLQDKVQIAPGNVAAPGELVANRHTEKRVDGMLRMFGTSLGREVGTETKPHGEAVDRGHSNAHALGGMLRFMYGGAAGRAPGAGGGNRWVPGGSTTAFARMLAGRFGLSLGSGYRDAATNARVGGSPTSDHMRGTPANPGAWDIPVSAYGPQAGLGDQLAAMARRLGVPQVLWRVADHFDHVHLGFGGGTSRIGAVGAGGAAGAGIMGGIAIPEIAVPATGGAGAPGALAAAAANVITQGMNQRLQAIGAAMGPAPTGGGAAAPAGQVRRWLETALRHTGHYSEANLNALYGRAMQESGGNPNAINNWDSNARAGYPSQGLLQTIPQTFAAYRDPSIPGGITDPIANTVAAINYMMARYGHIVGSNGKGYALGGRVPEMAGWFAEGGTVTASRPTLLGIGESGTETAVITRGSGGGRGGVRIENITVHNHRPGDIRDQIKREVDQAFSELGATLGSMSQEQEVLG